MYINNVKINNIRSVRDFGMSFLEGKQAGWHVLIGDNGSGKSSIIKSIALGLLGEENGKVLLGYEDFGNWLNEKQTIGEVAVTVRRDDEFDKPIAQKSAKTATSTIKIISSSHQPVQIEGKVNTNALWGKHSLSGWFYAAYGPFRRMRGGAEIFTHVMLTRPRIGATITAFREDAALTQLTYWLKDLALDATKNEKKRSDLEQIIQFINNAELLPNGAVLLNDIDSEGIKLKDPWGNHVSLMEMSDGYRSVLSMTLDIIRFMIEIYGAERVFSSSTDGLINVPGVVLIDEVDAHLHPTWQTKIGQWFTKYFPNIQFIVTTHSPLVCRACENNGSIWRLAAPGSNISTSEVTGIDKQRLIYGDILDAYSTDAFGENVTQSSSGIEMAEEMAALTYKSFEGTITPEEKKKLIELKSIMPTATS